jgi:hypothetical protein
MCSTISIDLGLVNFAYTTFGESDNIKEFDLIDTRVRFETAAKRCDFIVSFLKSHSGVDKMVIEKQTPLNIVCFALMYGFISAFKSLHPDGEVMVVDPIQKFKLLGIKCDTKNKNHKKAMVEEAKKRLSGENLEKFSKFGKKDDIADSIMQYLSLNIIKENKNNTNTQQLLCEMEKI